ncbi:RNA pyrophosphohydrolase [Algihabitans albus]|uniref:RNA pyrophosphohydrolase n=1 Tax=Algihabitans albus TaxID=2164067 RepID=UPI000E5CFCA0|nr:RNA pyrophosphohydrolase [Algihabitans albus]
MSRSDTVYGPGASGPLPSAEQAAALPFRLGVGAVLFNRERKVFAAQRADMANAAWQMPQGGIDKGEDPEAAVFRELEEETGTANARLIAESRDWLTYDLPLDLVPKLWKGRYRGQKQKWYALEFLGTDAEFDIFGPHAEFKAWKWAEFKELPALIVPFKRDLYRRILEEFRHLS